MRPAVVVTLVLTSLLAVTGAEDGRQESLSSARRIRSVATENAEGQTRKDEDSTGSGDDDEEGGGSGNDHADEKREKEDKAGAAEVGFTEGLRGDNSSTARAAGSRQSSSRQYYLPANPPIDARTIISKRLTCNKKRLPLYDWCKTCICWQGNWYCSAQWCVDWPGSSHESEAIPSTEYPSPVTEDPTSQEEYTSTEPEYPSTEPGPLQLVTFPPRPTRFYPPGSIRRPWNSLPGAPWPHSTRKPSRYGRRPSGRRPPPGVTRPSRRPWPSRRPRPSRYPWPPRKVRPGTSCQWWKKGECVLRSKKQ